MLNSALAEEEVGRSVWAARRGFLTYPRWACQTSRAVLRLWQRWRPRAAPPQSFDDPGAVAFRVTALRDDALAEPKLNSVAAAVASSRLSSQVQPGVSAVDPSVAAPALLEIVKWSGPEGEDYAVCVAPVCDGDEDCPGGMFGCDEATCVVPSLKFCQDKVDGAPCSRMVRGAPVEGFCSPMGLCLPACVSDENLTHGSCTTNPASTRCVDITMPGGSTQGLCLPRI